MKLVEVVLEAKDGGTPSRKNPNFFGGDINWCVVKDIQKEIFESKEKLTQEGINNSSAKVWPVGTIIISLGATIGEVGIARVPTATKQGLAGIVVDGTKVIPEFLAYVLRGKKRIIQHMARGVTIKEVRPSRLLKELEIEIPPIAEQKRIVAILDKADEIRINSEYSQQIRETLVSSVFLDTFGDPSSWTASDSTTLGDLCIKVKQAKPIEIFSDEFTYIDIASIDRSLGAITEPKSVQASDAPSRARQILQTGDILISTVRPYLRGTAVVEADYDNAIGSTGFCVLRPSDNSHSSFIYAFSRLDWFSEQLMGVATGASYPAVKKRDVEDLRVPIIEEGVLSIFNDTIAVIDELFSTNNPTVRRAIELSRSLCGELLDQTTI